MRRLTLTDDELIDSLKRLAAQERANQAEILRHLRELSRRHCAERKGFPSLFEFCLQELRWAEGDTARRLQVVRAAKSHPFLLHAVKRGLLSVTGAALLAPHLTRKNRRELYRAALGKRTRQIEALVATLSPVQEPPERLRFLGSPSRAKNGEAPAPCAAPAGETPSASAPPPESTPPVETPPLPPAPQRVLFSFTGDERLLACVERAKELLLNKYGEPGYEEVFVEAVDALLAKLDPATRAERAARPKRPGESRSRVPPSWVKRTVWRRDRGRCSFRAPDGRRCESSAGLQFDHVVPWALGGPSDDPANIRLLCRNHNRLEAGRTLGEAVVGRAIERKAAAGTPGP